jgi:hypothetical protein
VTKELNTLLTGLYVLIDDHVVPARTGRGRRPLFTDSELLTLAVAQVLLRYDSERRWGRYIHSDPELREMFPYLPQQPGLHKRLKNAQALLCKAICVLAQHCPSWFDDLWITGATPVPCGMSRETVKRSNLAGHGGYGYCSMLTPGPASKCVGVACANSANGIPHSALRLQRHRRSARGRQRRNDIVNTNANKCLDVTESNSANGRRLQIRTCTGGAKSEDEHPKTQTRAASWGFWWRFRPFVGTR